jgi:hypothetical protein
LYFPELNKLVPDRLSQVIPILAQIPSYAPSLTKGKEGGFQGKGAYPAVHLDDVASSKSYTHTLFEAIKLTIDGPTHSIDVG